MPWIATSCLLLSLAASPPAAAGCGDPGAVRYEPRTFLGHACEDDCERHKAGFRWAQRRAVAHPCRCRSLPRAEAEGCAAFLDEGADAEAVGARWAIENEIALPCLCRGAGERFEAGCRRAVAIPAVAPP